jgi:uncharacterized protein (DUF305 family)
VHQVQSMRSVYMVAAAALGTLALSACGGGDEEGVADSRPRTDSSSAVPFDLAFIDAMVPHHRAAIEMATAAKKRGLHQES